MVARKWNGDAHEGTLAHGVGAVCDGAKGVCV